jgi:hypothetical protein
MTSSRTLLLQGRATVFSLFYFGGGPYTEDGVDGKMSRMSLSLERETNDNAMQEEAILLLFRLPKRFSVWQNCLNYSGSNALVIAIQAILTQRASNGTTYWSVESPPNTTTVQQDQNRFTSHEGEFTITPQLTNF